LVGSGVRLGTSAGSAAGGALADLAGSAAAFLLAVGCGGSFGEGDGGIDSVPRIHQLADAELTGLGRHQGDLRIVGELGPRVNGQALPRLKPHLSASCSG
jgi:hypothetical protein